MNSTPWSQLKAEHDRKLRDTLNPAQYWMFRGKRVVRRRWGNARWRFQRRVGQIVELTQRLCHHDHGEIVRYLKDDEGGVGYITICDFCGHWEVAKNDTVLDETFQRLAEGKSDG